MTRLCQNIKELNPAPNVTLSPLIGLFVRRFYKKYLSVDDTVYLDWAIKQVVCWDQEEPHPEAIYIHGDKDIVFPHSCEGKCIVIKGGTHIMIINKYKWFNENLPKLISSTT